DAGGSWLVGSFGPIQVARNDASSRPVRRVGRVGVVPTTTVFSEHPEDLKALLRVLSAFTLRSLRPASDHDLPQDWIVASPVAPLGRSYIRPFMARAQCRDDTTDSQ
ncbi:MAG: hypothetical protein KDI60_09540, partial [Xanthomonadales bacterium]|nr:hypothetical protein [Xanthomonadales bacterium]